MKCSWSGLTSNNAQPSVDWRSTRDAISLTTSDAVADGSTPIALALPSKK